MCPEHTPAPLYASYAIWLLASWRAKETTGDRALLFSRRKSQGRKERFSLASRWVFPALDSLVQNCGWWAYHVGDFRGERAPWESKIKGSKRRHLAFSTCAG